VRGGVSNGTENISGQPQQPRTEAVIFNILPELQTTTSKLATNAALPAAALRDDDAASGRFKTNKILSRYQN